MNNTSFEAIKSLVSMLVKKAGYNVYETYASEELEKTVQTLDELKQEIKEHNETEDRYTELKELINNLEKRKSSWENNAEVLGKKILEEYKSSNDSEKIASLLNKLVLSIEKTLNEENDASEISSIYEKIKSLEEEHKILKERINNYTYENSSLKSSDQRESRYLNKKINIYEKKLEELNREIEVLSKEESEDKINLDKAKDKKKEIEEKLEQLISIKIKTLNKDVTNEIWDQLETAERDIKRKCTKVKDYVESFQQLLNNTLEEIDNAKDLKDQVQNILNLCNEKLKPIEERLEADSYIDGASKIIDRANLDTLRIKIDVLNNQKDVVYIDVEKIKNEILKLCKIDDYQFKEEENLIEEEQNLEVKEETQEKFSEEPTTETEEIPEETNIEEETEEKLEPKKEILEIRVETKKETKHEKMKFDW